MPTFEYSNGYNSSGSLIEAGSIEAETAKQAELILLERGIFGARLQSVDMSKIDPLFAKAISFQQTVLFIAYRLCNALGIDSAQKLDTPKLVEFFSDESDFSVYEIAEEFLAAVETLGKRVLHYTNSSWEISVFKTQSKEAPIVFFRQQANTQQLPLGNDEQSPTCYIARLFEVEVKRIEEAAPEN